MFRIAKWLSWVAAVAVAVLLGTAGTARATIELDLASGSSTVTKSDPNSGGSVSYTGAVGNFSVVMAYGDSNSPGGQSALAEAGSITLTNNSSSAQTITIKVSAQDFTAPVNPALEVTDTVSGSVAKGSVVSVTAQGYADSSNTLFGQGFASTQLNLGTYGNGTSFSANGVAGSFNSGSKYSLTFIETITLAGNSSVTLTGGNVQAMLPEPTSMMAAFTAMPFLGLGVWMRRRKQAV